MRKMFEALEEAIQKDNLAMVKLLLGGDEMDIGHIEHAPRKGIDPEKALLLWSLFKKAVTLNRVDIVKFFIELHYEKNTHLELKKTGEDLSDLLANAIVQGRGEMGLLLHRGFTARCTEEQVQKVRFAGFSAEHLALESNKSNLIPKKEDSKDPFETFSIWNQSKK
jgi:hypothetical protein